MRITLGQLRKVIKEEIQRIVESTDAKSVGSWKTKAKARLGAGEDKELLAAEWDNLVATSKSMADELSQNKEIAALKAGRRGPVTQEKLVAIIATSPELYPVWDKASGAVRELAQLIVRDMEYTESGAEMADALQSEVEAHAASSAKAARDNKKLEDMLKDVKFDFSDLYADRGAFRTPEAADREEFVNSVKNAIKMGDDTKAQQLVADYKNKQRQR